MPFVAVCSCSKHQEWHHHSSVDLRVATFYEEKYCNVDSKHGGRKRKICLACRGRIELEEKYRKLESADESSVAVHVFELEENNFPDEKSHFLPEQSGNPVANSDPSPCTDDLNSVSRGTQVPDLPLRPYKDAQERTQRAMRSQIIETVRNTAMKYVHNVSGESLQELIVDVIGSRQWSQVFGSSSGKEQTSEDMYFLNILAEEYRKCKDKEMTKTIKSNARKQTENFLIGNTKAQSRLTLEGKMIDNVKSRIDAAKRIGRVCHYGDEKRRLLSIVAGDFPYRTSQQLFGCSPNTVTAARVHCLLFGRGGVPPEKFKFTRQRVSPQIIQELTEFLNRDTIARASSCRSVLVEGEETAVRYWQDSVKNIVQQYRLEFPNGVKRSYVYTHLPRNFRMSTMLAGLCNLCDDFGHSNFDAFCSVAKDVSNIDGSTLNSAHFVKNMRQYQTFLKKTFSKSAERHSTCKELCMNYAFGSCSEDHPDYCTELTSFYDACEALSSALEPCEPGVQLKFQEKVADAINTHWEYISHLLRTKHQADYYQFVLKNLKPGECVVVVDYKMKLELGKRTREIQRDWYGKRGISLHGFYVVAKMEENERSAEVIDLWSEDTKQDMWFTQSALDICFSWLETAFPGFRVYLFSDNGPHYHNTGFLLYLSEINEAFNLTLVEYNNFEAGEGKTVLDTHFAHISHKIVRWVRVGNNLQTGVQLGELVGSIKNTSCFQLLIDRQKAPKNVRTLKDISLFGSFSFPLAGEFSGGITCSSLAGVGKTMSKTKSQLQALSGRRNPIAGATGATTAETTSHQAKTTGILAQSCPSDSYSVHFIQHAPKPLQSVHKCPIAQYPHKERQPKEGFALKKGGGKRVLFTVAQKEIMMEFYDRQATLGIRAKPEDAVEVMKQRGLEPLKESQIKSWWQTYHQKRKAALNTLTEQANSLAALTPQQQTTSSSQGSTVPVTPASSAVPSSCTAQSTAHTVPLTPPVSSSQGNTVPATPASSALPSSCTAQSTANTLPLSQPVSSSQGNTVPAAQASSAVPSSCTAQSTAHTVPLTQPVSNSQGNTMHTTSATSHTVSQGKTSNLRETVCTSSDIPVTISTPAPSGVVSYLHGIPSSHTQGIIEWHFPVNFSQSKFLGRQGSNACTFIAMYFGHLYFSTSLQPPTDSVRLNSQWKRSLWEAILKGNDIHDDLFDNDAVDVAVDDAVEVAGDECGVLCIQNQYDIIGSNRVKQLSDVFGLVAVKQSCHVVVSEGRSILLIVNVDQSTMIVN